MFVENFDAVVNPAMPTRTVTARDGQCKIRGPTTDAQPVAKRPRLTGDRDARDECPIWVGFLTYCSDPQAFEAIDLNVPFAFRVRRSVWTCFLADERAQTPNGPLVVQFSRKGAIDP